ncbi:hypothetical protein ACLOJK_039365 [Asimina triloba]
MVDISPPEYLTIAPLSFDLVSGMETAKRETHLLGRVNTEDFSYQLAAGVRRLRSSDISTQIGGGNGAGDEMKGSGKKQRERRWVEKKVRDEIWTADDVLGLAMDGVARRRRAAKHAALGPRAWREGWGLVRMAVSDAAAAHLLSPPHYQLSSHFPFSLRILFYSICAAIRACGNPVKVTCVFQHTSGRSGVRIGF